MLVFVPPFNELSLFVSPQNVIARDRNPSVIRDFIDWSPLKDLLRRKYCHYYKRKKQFHFTVRSELELFDLRCKAVTARAFIL